MSGVAVARVTVPIMRFRRVSKAAQRRAPRGAAFKSTELITHLRAELAPWLSSEGLRRLGGRAWTRPHGDDHLIVAVQAGQSGWDRDAGNKFIVEFELARSPQLGTGRRRQRLWSLLDESGRERAAALCAEVATTLPPPSDAFVMALPPDTRDHYLRTFRPLSSTSSDLDIWFPYYDETDAERWGMFLREAIGPALNDFLRDAEHLRDQ